MDQGAKKKEAPEVSILQILDNPERVKVDVNGQHWVFYAPKQEIIKFKTLLDHSKGMALDYLKQHSTGSEKLLSDEDKHKMESLELGVQVKIKAGMGYVIDVKEATGETRLIMDNGDDITVSVQDIEEVVTSGNIGSYPLPFGVNDQGEVDEYPEDPSSRFAGRDKAFKRKKKKYHEGKTSGLIGSNPNPTGVGETGETAQFMKEPGLRFKKHKEKKMKEDFERRDEYERAGKKFERSKKVLDKMLGDSEKSSKKDFDPERLSIILNKKYPLGGEY